MKGCSACKKIYGSIFDKCEHLFQCEICGSQLEEIDLNEIEKYTDNQELIKLYKDRAERLKKYEKPVITCPYCQSTDTKKISGTSRFMSTGVLGLASGKLGKQWHCKKCGSDF